MSSSSPSPSAARWSSSWTGMSCSIEPRIIRVGLISSSTPRCRKSASFLGLLTRAIVRGTSKWCLAIWQMTRLSSSSPVTAATTSARLQPASPRYLPSQPSWAMTIEPISSAICCARDAVLLHERDLVARFDELLGEVVADLPAADDEYEHGSGLLGRCWAGVRRRGHGWGGSAIRAAGGRRYPPGSCRVVPAGVLPIGCAGRRGGRSGRACPAARSAGARGSDRWRPASGRSGTASRSRARRRPWPGPGR